MKKKLLTLIGKIEGLEKQIVDNNFDYISERLSFAEDVKTRSAAQKEIVDLLKTELGEGSTSILMKSIFNQI